MALLVECAWQKSLQIVEQKGKEVAEEVFVVLEKCYVSASISDGSSTLLVDIYEEEKWMAGLPNAVRCSTWQFMNN